MSLGPATSTLGDGMRRRALSAITAGTLVGLLGAPDALARAGGGSSGFSGGFGGGRGSGGGFGRGHFFFIPVGGGGGIFLLILILAVVFFVLPRLVMWWRGQQSAGMASRQRVAQRERRVELAAAEAAEDDEAFAPEQVRSQAAGLFVDIQSAWDAGDRVRLRGLVAPELLAEWERRLDDFDRKGWRNRVQPIGEPSIEYVGLSNRGDDRGDRVVVRIEARLRDYVEDAYGQRVGRVDAVGDTSRVREFWTLAKRDSHWILQSIEQGAEGAHSLSEDLLATPWADEQAMRDEALVQGAVQDAVPEGRRSPRLPISTSTAMDAPPHLTCRLPTAGSRPTSSRSPRGAPLPAGPTPLTETTVRCWGCRDPMPRANCYIRATQRGARAWSCAAWWCVTSRSCRSMPRRNLRQ